MTVTTTARSAPPVDRVVVARTVGEVEALRPLWERLGAGNIDADIDYFLAVVRSAPDVLGPHVLHLERPGRQDLVVVARRVDQRVPLRIGYRRVATLRLRALLVSFDGILGVRSEDDHDAALAAVRAELGRGAADVVVFQKLPADSALWRVARTGVPPAQRAASAPVAHHRLTTADSLDALLDQRPSKSRQRIRREMSRFRRDHAGRFEIRRLDSAEGVTDDSAQLERDIEAVAALTYQRNLELGSVRPSVQSALLATARDRGWLRAWMLYLDGRPVSFWWGMRYGPAFEPGSTGYDPAHHDAGVGTFTFLQMVDDLCHDPQVEVIDFGFGDAEYKRRFSTSVEDSRDLRVYARRPRAMLVRAATAAVALAGTAVQRLRSSRWADALKRRWRRSAAAQASERGGAR